jgi:hypothetical protein
MTKKIALFALIATMGLGLAAPSFADEGTPEELGQVTLRAKNMPLPVAEIEPQNDEDAA